MEEKRNKIQRQFSRRYLKFSCLTFIPELLGVALLIIGARRTDNARMPLLIAALIVFMVTMIVNLVGLRKMAAQRDAEIQELEQKYSPLEDWMNQNGETKSKPPVKCRCKVKVDTWKTTMLSTFSL